jgi:hypothetical protein
MTLLVPNEAKSLSDRLQMCSAGGFLLLAGLVSKENYFWTGLCSIAKQNYSCAVLACIGSNAKRPYYRENTLRVFNID